MEILQQDKLAGIVGGTIGSIDEGARAYKASKADAEETIETCTELKNDILDDLGINMQEAEYEADELRKQIGESEGRSIYSDAEDKMSRY